MREAIWTKEALRRLVHREIGDYRLVLVSNRQPYVHEIIDGKLQHASPSGGLITAIDPLMQECGGTWIAQSGGQADWQAVDEQNKVMVPPDDPSYTLRLVWLAEHDARGHYDGFSNAALWPLCHNAYIEPVFDTENWESYKAVNNVFANQVLDELDGRPGAVFTQDYHFALLPNLLRQADPSILTGQFWHIPWPNHEIFRICPWQDELLNGMLGNDMLGFHIGEHCENFLKTVERSGVGTVNFDYNMVSGRNGITLVRPFPISVDFEKICLDAQDPAVDEEMERVSAELDLEGQIIGLGIDRIDYTKGIPHRFRAVGRFLEKYPQYVGKVAFVQAGVMSRTDVVAYQQLSTQIDDLVEEINGRFGRDGWRPIIYMPTDLPDLTLTALRRLARFCVVSSLHDGMNLVAKEYVASRFDEDGVLILSPFTGAALELSDALIVNPYATEHFADAIHQAVEMPSEERRTRMVRMRSIVQENNIYKWAAHLLVDLMQGARRSQRPLTNA